MGDVVPILVLVVAGGIALSRALEALKALRGMAATPLWPIGSMPTGRVEVYGSAHTDEPLIAPFTQKPVVFWEVCVLSDNDKSPLFEYGDASVEPFWVEDETGRVQVMPADADTELRRAYRKFSWGNRLPAHLEAFAQAHDVSTRFLLFPKRLQFVERHIEEGQPVYVWGVAQERPDLDGLQRVIAEGGPEDPFLISDKSKRTLARRLRWAAGLWLAGGAACVALFGVAHWLGWIH